MRVEAGPPEGPRRLHLQDVAAEVLQAGQRVVVRLPDCRHTATLRKGPNGIGLDLVPIGDITGLESGMLVEGVLPDPGQPDLQVDDFIRQNVMMAKLEDMVSWGRKNSI